jgi:GxxExxY protein
MTENEIGTVVVEEAVALHRELGPGLLEFVYEVCLASALERRGLEVERQKPIAIEYRGIPFEEGFRANIIVGSKVILEIKSVERTTKAHEKEVHTYLRLTGLKLGYLLNFGDAMMKNGIERIVNGLEEDL